jgi:hypothetical protein
MSITILSSRRFVRIMFLSFAIITVSFLLPYTGYAATRSSPSNIVSPNYIQGPDIQCLSVTFSDVTNSRRVGVAAPPGEAVAFTLRLYVTLNAPCKAEWTVTSVTVVGSLTAKCVPPSVVPVDDVPHAFFDAGSLKTSWPGKGKNFNYQISCVTIKDGRPIKSSVPVIAYERVNATGLLIVGNVRRNVTSNTVQLLAW